jgi:rare lipoprotein A
LASYYASGLQGRQTASGELLDRYKLTAAHRSLSFGTCVTVVNVRTSASVSVRINDRGPYVASRIIDLTEAAAARIGLLALGVAPVRLYFCSR